MAKIEKLPSGNYRIRVVVGHTPDGKIKRKSFTGNNKAKLRRLAAEYADRRRVTGLNVGDAIDAFIAAKSPVLSPSTVKAYSSMAATLKSRHGQFCALSVDDMRQADLQRFINSLLPDHASKTICNYHGLLSAAFKFSGSSLPPVTLPRKDQKEILIPDEDMVRRISAAVEGGRLEVPVGLAMMGLRRSEICALALDDLDGNMLRIHRAVVYGLDNQTVEKDTKTYSSYRTIRIPDKIADRIRAQGFVTDYTPAGLSAAFRLMLKKNGLPHFRLHDMRHFFASYCHNVLLLSDAQIQAITGHKTSVVLRSNYIHAMNQQKTGEMVADSLSGLL